VAAPSAPSPAAGSAPIVAVERVEKVYRMGDVSVPALRGISLDVRAGEFVAVMGSSGSGKSTFMNIIGCLDRPTAGRYLLDGVNVADLGRNALARLRGRTIGFVFQSFNLLPRTSAIENVELPLIYRGVHVGERRRLALEALAKVGLADRAHHEPNELSGGQQQRVAIARAIVTSPQVILADEPTGNLDSATSRDIMHLLTALNRDAGITVAMVTHEPEMAEYAHHVIHFRDGEIAHDGPSAEAA
jgi:putative ABC transport system ATP-binding protein